MDPEKRARLKAKLAKMSPKEQKEYLRLRKEKRAARLAATSEPVVSSVEVETYLTEVLELGKTKAEARKLKSGLTLFDIWKGLRALAAVVVGTSKSVSEMHKAGVIRRSANPELVPAGAEVASVDADKLEAFVKTLPGVWELWKCADAVCAECPYHRGKGVNAQNRECADHAKKIAQKHNRAAVLYKGMPFSKKSLDAMPRRQLVSLCGIVKVSPFRLEDPSKEGIAKMLLTKMKVYKAPKKLPQVLEIPRLAAK